MERFLLTSDGVKNRSIANSLKELVGKKPEETNIGFITTASNPERGNGLFYLNPLNDLATFGFKWVNLVDIATPPPGWKTYLEDVDVVIIGGGNTFYLLDQARKSGFSDWIVKNKDEKVFVGISAGSIIFTPNIGVATVEPADRNDSKILDFTGLNLVQFEISPHTPGVVSMKNAEAYSLSIDNPLYAMDDSAAIQVVDGKMTEICGDENSIVKLN